MGLESGTYIDSLNQAWPIGTEDPVSQADDHLRLIKAVLKNTFPNVDAEVEFTPGQINLIGTIMTGIAAKIVLPGGESDSIVVAAGTVGSGDNVVCAEGIIGPGANPLYVSGILGSGSNGIVATGVTGTTTSNLMFAENPTFNANATNIGIQKRILSANFSVDSETSPQVIPDLSIDNLLPGRSYLLSGYLHFEIPDTTNGKLQLLNSLVGFTATLSRLYVQWTQSEGTLTVGLGHAEGNELTLTMATSGTAAIDLSFTGKLHIPAGDPETWSLAMRQETSVIQPFTLFRGSWIKSELEGIS